MRRCTISLWHNESERSENLDRIGSIPFNAVPLKHSTTYTHLRVFGVLWTITIGDIDHFDCIYLSARGRRDISNYFHGVGSSRGGGPEKTGCSRGPVQWSTPRRAPPIGIGGGFTPSVFRRSFISTAGTLAVRRYCPVTGFKSISPTHYRSCRFLLIYELCFLY
jgi:hypothetical protein